MTDELHEKKHSQQQTNKRLGTKESSRFTFNGKLPLFSFFFCLLCVFPYLNKREMNDHWDGAAKYAVGPKLCTVAHAIVSAISCYDNPLSHSLEFLKHLCLVLVPVDINCWEQLTL